MYLRTLDGLYLVAIVIEKTLWEGKRDRALNFISRSINRGKGKW